VSTSVTGTGRPSTVIVWVVTVWSAASAQLRSSASVVPLPSQVLHSVDQATAKILVPGSVVHGPVPSGPNGARTPSKWIQVLPPLNGLSGDGVWSTVVQRSPSMPPSRWFGVAL